MEYFVELYSGCKNLHARVGVRSRNLADLDLRSCFLLSIKWSFPKGTAASCPLALLCLSE